MSQDTEETKASAGHVEDEGPAVSVKLATSPRKAMSVEGAAHEGHHANTKEYLTIFAVLALLTALELGLVKVHVSTHLMVIGLVGLAITKAAVVALFYMHLKSETRLLRISIAIPLSLPMFYALVLISDGIWRHFA